ncbi:MAG: chemotaxis protein CheW [Thiohalomonadaceae bacterium]
MKPRAPFELLFELESRALAHAFGLPQREEVRKIWHGVGFRLGGIALVVPLGQVREVLVSPPVSRVPGAKPWVAGIANVRGTLLPILDLQGFLSIRSTLRGRRTRVLVVEHGGVAAGLMVDEVLGLRHFFEEEDRAAQLPMAADSIRNYLVGAFSQAGQLWGVFDMHRLIQDPDFMQVAA